MTRSPGKASAIEAAGAAAVVCDVFDRDALHDAIGAFAPDAVVHQLTDLPDDPARLDEFKAANSRIRREGTQDLLAAAAAAVVLEVRRTERRLGDPRRRRRRRRGAPARRARCGRRRRPLRPALRRGDVVSGRAAATAPVHVDHAARSTLPALTAQPGVLIVTDDR